MHIQVLIGSVAAVLLVQFLVPTLLRRRDRLDSVPWPVTTSFLAVILGPTIGWPVLFYSGFTPSWAATPRVNVIGKWTYLTVALVTVVGLCLMASHFIGTSARGHSRRRWTWTVAIDAIIILAVVPGAIGSAQLADPHASGLVPSNLLYLGNLFDALPQFLDWLLLAIAIVVLVSLPEKPDPRPVVRRIAIPIMLLILYWNSTWLYLPVTLALGLVALAKLVFPLRLAYVSPHTSPPATALKKALAAWRRAEFAANQRQALAAGSSDALRDTLIKDGSAGYAKGFEALVSTQNELAEQRDRWQEDARAYKVEAFDHEGEPLDKQTAFMGAITGTLLAIVPISVLLLTTHPIPGWSGYPVLDFLGGTAWRVFQWTVLGWSIGYFLPLIRGKNGAEKALWILAAGVIVTLPMDVLSNDGRDWTQELIYDLELFSFLMIVTVILCDLMVLKAAGMRAAAWVQVHNWRFVVTLSTALLAAIGTAAVTFLSTAATDIGHHTFSVFTGPGNTVGVITGSSNAPTGSPKSP
jgi:hypothetical protein